MTANEKMASMMYGFSIELDESAGPRAWKARRYIVYLTPWGFMLAHVDFPLRGTRDQVLNPSNN